MPGQLIVDPDHPQWLQYSGGGPHFMCGPGDPENFLYRGTRQADGTRNGDQTTLINKMIGTGANCIYFQAIRSHGGDGQADHNPFIDSDPTKNLDTDILDQWETWFTAMDNAGIVIYLFFYDDAIRVSTSLGWPLSSGNLHSQEAYFIQTIVNRFEHHKHLVWCVMEEVQEMGGDYQAHAKAIAAAIRQADDHDHPIAVHKLSGVTFTEFADDPNIDIFAIQYNQSTVTQMHTGMLTAWDNAAGRYSLNMSEMKDHGALARPDLRKMNWACAMGGAYVMVLGMDIAGTSTDVLDDCGRLVSFFESTNFNEMSPRDDLAYAGTKWVLAKPGEAYIAYADNLTGNIGVQGMLAGTYDLVWCDIPTGAKQTSQATVNSGSNEFAKPSGIGSEVAVWIKGAESYVPILTSVDLVPDSATIQADETYPFAASAQDQFGVEMTETINWSVSGGGTILPTGTFVSDGSVGVFVVRAVAASNASIGDSAILTVLADYPAPTAQNSDLITTVNTPVALSLPFQSQSPGPFDFTISKQPDHGSLNAVGNDVTYIPASGYTGTDTYKWTVTDQSSGKVSNEATVTITINGSGVAAERSVPFDRVSAQFGEAGEGGVAVQAYLPRPGGFQLQILDVRGQVLWDHRGNTDERGVASLRWHIHGVRSGVYFLHLEQDTRRIGRRVVLAR